MRTTGKKIVGALALGLLLATLSACEKPAGPAERAGREVDQAVDRAGQQLEKAGHSIQDGAKGDKK